MMITGPIVWSSCKRGRHIVCTLALTTLASLEGNALRPTTGAGYFRKMVDSMVFFLLGCLPRHILGDSLPFSDDQTSATQTSGFRARRNDGH